MAEEIDDTRSDGVALPTEAVEEAERLTRLARAAADPAEATAYRDHRADLLDEHGFTARVREEADGAVLVCHPADWLDEDGVVDLAAVEDTDRAEEVRLSGRGEQGTYADAETTNADLVAAVREDGGDVHAANVRAFADYMGNHYASPIDAATETHVREFLEEYYPRNAWPSDEQQAVVRESLRRAFEKTETAYPLD